MTTNVNVYSLYWNNIHRDILRCQRDVFDFLGVRINQEGLDGHDHGAWMTSVLERSANDAIVVFCDIDAFPLTRSAYDAAISQAAQGMVVGLAQFSNHTKTKELYAGPMFLALRRDVWVSMGKPDLRPTDLVDAAEILSIIARERGVALKLIKPTSCVKSKWALGSDGIFGIGTFYGDLEFFHLFESRQQSSVKLITQVAEDVMNSGPFRFDLYLKTIHTEHQSKQRFSRIINKIAKKLMSSN